ncbi:MAG: cyclic nucleotide-binding domain-containing protein [Anaerolineales bacterium]|jgi:CRP-like cAMP-binding protein
MCENGYSFDLSVIPLFQGVPKEILQELGEKICRLDLETDEVLFRQGDPGDALYIIERGRVKIVAEGLRNQDLILNTYGAGEIVGEMSMIDQKPRSAGVVATEPTQLLQLKREDFLVVATHQPDLALRVMINLSGRLRFSAAYLQQAVAWSEKIATGNYDSAINEIIGVQKTSGSEDDPRMDRADEFLAAFFKMVSDVKAREEGLREQLNAFKIHIDDAKKKEEVDDLVGSEFFKQLEALTQRSERSASR